MPASLFDELPPPQPEQSRMTAEEEASIDIAIERAVADLPN